MIDAEIPNSIGLTARRLLSGSGTRSPSTPIKALSKDASADDLLAVNYRLQGLANLTSGADVASLSMSLHGKTYKLINEAAFRAAAVCPLRLTGTMVNVNFDHQKFLDLVLSFAEPESNG
jgi:hypothetical protein